MRRGRAGKLAGEIFRGRRRLKVLLGLESEILGHHVINLKIINYSLKGVLQFK